MSPRSMYESFRSAYTRIRELIRPDSHRYCSFTACYLKLWFGTEQSELKQSKEALPPLSTRMMLARVRLCTLRAQVGGLSLWSYLPFLGKFPKGKSLF